MRLLSCLAVAALFLGGCGGPCTELDQVCERCEGADPVAKCKYGVARLNDQTCDTILEAAKGNCPLRLLVYDLDLVSRP